MVVDSDPSEPFVVCILKSHTELEVMHFCM